MFFQPIDVDKDLSYDKLKINSGPIKLNISHFTSKFDVVAFRAKFCLASA
jgi:hypothetical protein